MRRIIDCRCSDFLNMSRRDLLDSIAQCEGRTVCCETVGTLQAMLGDVTNAEFAAAMGSQDGPSASTWSPWSRCSPARTPRRICGP